MLRDVAEAVSAQHWIGVQPIRGKKLVVRLLIQMILIGVPQRVSLKPAPQEIHSCDWLRCLYTQVIHKVNYVSSCPVKLIMFCFRIHTRQRMYLHACKTFACMIQL